MRGIRATNWSKNYISLTAGERVRGDKTAAKTIKCGSVLDQKDYNSMKNIGSTGSASGSMRKILSNVVRTSIGVRHLSEI